MFACMAIVDQVFGRVNAEYTFSLLVDTIVVLEEIARDATAIQIARFDESVKLALLHCH